MKRWRSRALFLLGLAGVLALLWWAMPLAYRVLPMPLLFWLDRPAGEPGPPRTFHIAEGENAATVAERLAAEGLVRDARLFRALAVRLGVDRHLEAGTYELVPGETARAVLERLEQPLVQYRSVTLLEGWRREEMADELERRGIVPREAFLEATRRADGYAYDFLAALPPGGSLEGYLFPDTYYFPLEPVGPEEVVRMLLDNFGRRVTPVVQQRSGAQDGLTLHQLITLASIVEREARVAEERPIIADILLRRLQQGMRLEADPTVQYALVPAGSPAPADGYWKEELWVEDMEVQSPYNTYRVAGLPPGPIANPGLDSIRAVLDPTPTDYWYFVAKEDGSHAFARTFEEHLLNLQRYGY